MGTIETKRVVITGAGVLSPIGNSYSEFSTNIMAGKSGASTIEHFDTSNFNSSFACMLSGFDPAAVLDKKEIKRLDPYVVYALSASMEAVAHAGLDFETLNRDRTGVVWATGIGGLISLSDELKAYYTKENKKGLSPLFVPKFILNMASGHIAMKFGLHGPNYNAISACASSTSAMIDAFNLLRLGKAECIITGGSEAIIEEIGFGGFAALRALSTRNESPETASRPFDVDRDGFVMGEGAASLVLETLEHAQNRGAPILAEVSGGGMSGDAYHMTSPHPEGKGAKLAMKNALEDADLDPADIGYINCHATSTVAGDVSETLAIKELFADTLGSLHISGTKSMTGHMLGAAGAAEALACVCALDQDKLPPTINTAHIDPAIDPSIQIITGRALENRVRHTMSNTFGFGGQNAAVIISRFEN